MKKKVLILLGSARKRGNSSLMADEFARGAKETGHEVKKIYIKDKKISGCLGCGLPSRWRWMMMCCTKIRSVLNWLR